MAIFTQASIQGRPVVGSLCCVFIFHLAQDMRSALALVLGLATVGSLALNVQPHRTQLARRVRLSRPGLAGPRMQNEEEIAELEARLSGLKKAKVRCVRVQGRSRASTRQLGAHAECMRTCGCVGIRVCESQGALRAAPPCRPAARA